MPDRKVLILDFDFFTTLGGGQVLYRRLVERNPGIEFFYPSNGADLTPEIRSRLPGNARPFPYDRNLDVSALDGVLPAEDWLNLHFLKLVARVLAPVQGLVFEAVDVPSFRPAAHVVRWVADCFGMTIGRVALGLVGWGSQSFENAYEKENSSEAALAYLERIRDCEAESMAAADVRYTISQRERAADFGNTLPIVMLDMHDTIEHFGDIAAVPPGSGPPDLWYVGRLDGAKGPDLFIELASRLPRPLFGNCFLAGPDNDWAPKELWSRHLEEMAAAKGLEATYVGTPSDADIRSRVYGGRTVLVVPSRTDAFNYVALEAVLNGCPVLLSSRTGASGFLRDHHPHLLPPIMEPDDLNDATAKLFGLLKNYQTVAASCRQNLRTKPVPPPRRMFMNQVYGAPPASSADWRRRSRDIGRGLRTAQPLCSPAMTSWRPARPPAGRARLSLLLPVPDDLSRLPPVLANLARQTCPDIELLLIDGKRDRFRAVQRVTDDLAPWSTIMNVPAASEAEGINRALARAAGDYVCLLDDGVRLAPGWGADAVAALDAQPDAVAAHAPWGALDEQGYEMFSVPVAEADRPAMLTGRGRIPGPGAVLRRAALMAAGGRDPFFRFLGDADMWLRVSGAGRLIALPDAPVVWCRLQDHGSASPDILRDMAVEHVRLIERFFRTPEEERRYGPLMDVAFNAAQSAASATVTLGGQKPHFLTRLPVGWPAYLWPED